MDPVDPSSPSPRKLKFKPKAPPRKQSRLAVPKHENRIDEDGEALQAEKLMNKFNENLRRQVPKVEKKAPVQVAFGPGAPSSSFIRKYGVPNVESPGSSRQGTEHIMDVDGESPSTASKDGAMKVKKQYKEPWDYHYSNYPTTLPWRRPYSGDPEVLDEAEFGEAARNLEYDENTMNPASDLGLLEDSENERLFFFQIPEMLPFIKRSASAKGKEKAEGSIPLESKDASRKTSLEELPPGYMGKLQVYRSGAVKLKLGDTVFDVSPGSECSFAQDVVTINTVTKDCCAIGELGKRAVATPNIDFILNPVINLD